MARLAERDQAPGATNEDPGNRSMLTISGKALGRRKPLFTDWSIPLPPDLGGEGRTLRDLIVKVVNAEVLAFKERQEQRRVFRALTARDIEAGAVRGKIESGGSQVPLQPVDADAAIATALQAFEDGLYLVIVDGLEQKRLDSPLYLHSDSRVTFVRLTMLAGG